MVNKNNIKIIQGGFSEPILQPCYLVSIGTIFLLAPIIGWLPSILIVAVPALYIAVRLASKESKRDELILDIICNNSKSYVSFIALSDLLRRNSYVTSPEILKKGLNISKSDSIKISQALIDAEVATGKKPVSVAVIEPKDIKKTRSLHLAQAAKA